MMKRTVAFDFDGTYTRHDSLPLMLKHAFGWEHYLLGMVICLPWIILFKLGILKGGEAKQRLLSHFFKGMPYSRFKQLCESFPEAHPNLVRHRAKVAMDEALEAGDQVLVVSASVREWVEPFFQGQNVKVLATELEVDDNGLLTGHYAKPNCNGAEKWRRIVQEVPDVEQRELVAYGDSGGDTVMLSHADKAYMRDFDTPIDMSRPDAIRRGRRFFWIVLALLVLYQLLGVFFGMDIADAGFYLTFYDNIFTAPSSVEYNFMYYLSGVIGGTFQSLFPSLGMAGMRLLGVVFNTLCAIILYYALRRHLDERAIALGCALVIVSFIAPPYTFCYDLCTIVFYVLAITLLWRGLMTNKTWVVAVAGAVAGLNILVRIPNVLGLSMALLPLIRYFAVRRYMQIYWVRPLFRTLLFLGSAGLALCFVLVLMPASHTTCLLNVLRDLRDIAADNTGTASHSTGHMIMVQLRFYATEAWVAVKLAVPVAIYWWAHVKARPLWLSWALKVAALAAFIWLIMRMHPLQPLWVMCLAGGIMVIIERWKGRSGLVWMAVLGIGMMLVMPLGSDGAYNNGTIIAWGIAPVAALWWMRRTRLAFPLAFIAVCAVRMVTGGAYFDGGPLWEKHYTVDIDRAAHIFTTRERADVINTMLKGIEPYVKPGDQLMAYGSAPLINYLTHTRPALGCSWVEQLSVAMLEKKLTYAPKTGLPMVLQQKFNSLGPYWSEPTENFNTDYGLQNTYRDNRKLEVLNRFLDRYGYQVVYEDSHFILYKPASGYQI
ncbi:MAG: HAD-IB family phosphatase [Muribaculaceae bacterium]|nr:HAD-IB family phosphatase [Muribaculaceae bacterium]